MPCCTVWAPADATADTPPRFWMCLIASRFEHTCIRKHTSAYVGIRRHTSAYVASRFEHTCIRQHTSAYVGIRWHTSAYVASRFGHTVTRQYTSAYVSIRQHPRVREHHKAPFMLGAGRMVGKAYFVADVVHFCALLRLENWRELCQQTSEDVSIRQHTSDVSIRRAFLRVASPRKLAGTLQRAPSASAFVLLYQ